MDKKEFVKSFVETLQNGEKDKIYKFFTSRSVVMFIDEKKEISLDETISYLEDTFLNKEIKIKRIFESAVCIKIELESEKFDKEALLFEIADRRIKRLEIM